MIDANKTIEDIEKETGKMLDEEERKVIEGFSTFLNMVWKNQDEKK